MYIAERWPTGVGFGLNCFNSRVELQLTFQLTGPFRARNDDTKKNAKIVKVDYTGCS